jgi:RimJ/RimL family protein N-acetyltransferase
MIRFYDLREVGAKEIADRLPLPKKDATEIMESYTDGAADAAISGAFGCLLVRICDGGEYLFSYPYPLTESADESGAVEEVALYALREGLPLVFIDVPRESLPILLMGFRHADVDAEDECADTYRVTVKSECALIKKAPEVTYGEVTLRELRDGDKEAYARICLDAENNKYWGYDFRDDEPDADADYFMSVAKNERALGTAISFAVLSGGEFVGEAALYAFDCRGGAEMAIRILPEYQGRGLSGDILNALFEVCRRIGLIRLYAEVFAENKPSIAFCSRYMETISDEGGRVVFIKNFYEP